MQAAYSVSLTQLDKAKKAYEKAFKVWPAALCPLVVGLTQKLLQESEKALDAYHKADADLNLSRAEVEKARMYSLAKGIGLRHAICRLNQHALINHLISRTARRPNV